MPAPSLFLALNFNIWDNNVTSIFLTVVLAWLRPSVHYIDEGFFLLPYTLIMLQFCDSEIIKWWYWK